VRKARFTHSRGDIEQNGRKEESQEQYRYGQQGCIERRPLRQRIPHSSPFPCAWGRKNSYTRARSQRLCGRRRSAAEAQRKATTTTTTTAAAACKHRHRRRRGHGHLHRRRGRGHLHDRRRSPPSVHAAVARVTIVAGRQHEQHHHRREGEKEVLVRWPGWRAEEGRARCAIGGGERRTGDGHRAPANGMEAGRRPTRC